MTATEIIDKNDEEQKKSKCVLCDKDANIKSAILREGKVKHLACMYKNGEDLTGHESDMYIRR